LLFVVLFILWRLLVLLAYQHNCEGISSFLAAPQKYISFIFRFSFIHFFSSSMCNDSRQQKNLPFGRFGLFPSGAILNQLARNAAPSRKDRFGMSFSFFIE